MSPLHAGVQRLMRRGCHFYRQTVRASGAPLPVPSCKAHILEDLRHKEIDQSGGNMLSMT